MRAVAICINADIKVVELYEEVMSNIRALAEGVEKNSMLNTYTWSEYDSLDVLSKGVMRVITRTTLVASHSLEFNLDTGELRMYHVGARCSDFSGTWAEVLPDCWYEGGLGAPANWLLESLETSQPDWGVKFGLMSGKIKSGPVALQEAVERGLVDPTFQSLSEAGKWIRKWGFRKYYPYEVLELLEKYFSENPKLGWKMFGHRDPVGEMCKLI